VVNAQLSFEPQADIHNGVPAAKGPPSFR
jgi:hypothetical protein